MGRNIVLSAGSSILAVVAFVVGVIAIATPYWATFADFNGTERGHFGPWTMCRQRSSRSSSEYLCGRGVSRLRPSEFTTAAGVCGVIAVLVTVLLCVTSPMVLAMRVTRRQVFFKFRTAVLVKIVFSCIGATCCMLALILFSLDINGRKLGEETGFRIQKSWSFYLLGVFFALFIALCIFSAGEFVLGRRLGGDPVKYARDPSGSLAPVLVNPAAREKRVASPNAEGVTVIAARQPAHVHQRPTTVASNGGGRSNGNASNGRSNGSASTGGGRSNGTSGGGRSNGSGGGGRSVAVSGGRSEEAVVTSASPTPVPYDPRKSPLRSSLKKRVEKRESSDESIDSGVVIIGNPGAPATPPACRNKKVRIQTLDTAV